MSSSRSMKKQRAVKSSGGDRDVYAVDSGDALMVFTYFYLIKFFTLNMYSLLYVFNAKYSLQDAHIFICIQ